MRILFQLLCQFCGKNTPAGLIKIGARSYAACIKCKMKRGN